MPSRRTHRRHGRAEPGDAERDLGPEADPESVARTIVLTKLTAQARSRAELEEVLASRGVPDDVATRVLDRFTEVGLVDDAAYAETWVRSRLQSRGLSRRALGQELRRKGVDAEVIQESLETIDAVAEEAAARELVARKLRSMSRLDEATQLRRLAGMLGRKGYAPGLAYRVAREAVHGSGRSRDAADVGWDASDVDN
ncbi:MAG: regulatory protein RecX [Nocardioidaceae bacterium]